MKKILRYGLLLFLSFFMVSCSGGGAEQVAKQFTSAVYSGDSKKAFSLVNFEGVPDDGTSEIVLGKLKSEINKVKQTAAAKGGVKSIKVDKVEYNDDKTFAFVIMTVSFKKSEDEKSERIKLDKTKKGWKIRL